MMRLLASVVLAASLAFPAAAKDDGGFVFAVIGDTPYSSDDSAMLREALPKVRENGYPFVIHLGDYKGGGQQCLEKFDERFAQLIVDIAPAPVFYTPGDNEWTDCDRHTDPTTDKKYSDLERLSVVRERFATGAPAGADAFRYARQDQLPENATWFFRGVRFLTLHVVGTNNGRDWVSVDPLETVAAETTRRDAANLVWLTEGFEKAASEGANAVVIAFHADVTDVAGKPEDVMCEDVARTNLHPCDAFVDLRKAIQTAALSFAKPVLVIHGDTAPFTLNQEIAGENAPNLWRLNAAGDAGVSRLGISYGLSDVTEVSVTYNAGRPFDARALVTGTKPN